MTTTTEPIDWNRVAVEIADAVRKQLPEEPIGVYQPEENLRLAVLFGNGETRYDEDRTTQSAVELVRQRIDGLGVMELGFGLDSETRSTWGMIVKNPDRVIDHYQLEWLEQSLNEAYRLACKQE